MRWLKRWIKAMDSRQWHNRATSRTYFAGNHPWLQLAKGHHVFEGLPIRRVHALLVTRSSKVGLLRSFATLSLQATWHVKVTAIIAVTSIKKSCSGMRLWHPVTHGRLVEGSRIRHVSASGSQHRVVLHGLHMSTSFQHVLHWLH